ILKISLGEGHLQCSCSHTLEILWATYPRVVETRGQRQGRVKIRVREIDFLGSLGRDFKAVDDDIVFIPLETGNQAVPLVLHESGSAAHSSGQRLSEINLESDSVCGIARVRKDVWSTALGVGGPFQFLGRSAQGCGG